MAYKNQNNINQLDNCIFSSQSDGRPIWWGF